MKYIKTFENEVSPVDLIEDYFLELVDSKWKVSVKKTNAVYRKDDGVSRSYHIKNGVNNSGYPDSYIYRKKPGYIVSSIIDSDTNVVSEFLNDVNKVANRFSLKSKLYGIVERGNKILIKIEIIE
jgi:hypothetical protein